MRDTSESSSLGAGLIVWVATFPACWMIFQGITHSTGLTLVFSVFASLVAFDMGRRSLKLAIVIISISVFALLLQGLYLIII
ncbi:MAG: hypothetical protein WCK63_08815 [Betaproteobacteria bacterium]